MTYATLVYHLWNGDSQRCIVWDHLASLWQQLTELPLERLLGPPEKLGNSLKLDLLELRS